MDSFLTRYYRLIDRNLGDPASANRYLKSDRLADLHTIDTQIYESLLNVLGMESLMGYAEAEIQLVANQEFYRFPVGFRHFFALEYRVESGGTQYAAYRLKTKGPYQCKYAVEIISSHRGFRLRPGPLDTTTWVLCYSRCPGLLHEANASGTSATTLITGTPATDRGTVIKLRDYYNGMEIRELTYGQVREVVGSIPNTGNMTLQLRHAWDTVPPADTPYEIRPTLPPEYDDLYAMDAAIPELNRRRLFDAARSLHPERHKLWNGARSYFISNTMDRGPARMSPNADEDTPDAWEGVPYCGYH